MTNKFHSQRAHNFGCIDRIIVVASLSSLDNEKSLILAGDKDRCEAREVTRHEGRVKHPLRVAFPRDLMLARVLRPHFYLSPKLETTRRLCTLI